MAGSGNLPPCSEGLIGGDQGGTALVAGADELEQDGGFRLVLADIGEVIEDQEVEAIEAIDGRLQCKLAACHLKPLHQVGGARRAFASPIRTLELTRFGGHQLVRSGRTPEELSREFEPTAQSIWNWVRQADRDEGRRQDGATSSEREELSRLRRENRQLRQERDILAKAAAWFARETAVIPSGSSNS
jgi:transposase